MTMYLVLTAAFVLFSSLVILWQVNGSCVRRDELRVGDPDALRLDLQPVLEPAAAAGDLRRERD